MTELFKSMNCKLRYLHLPSWHCISAIKCQLHNLLFWAQTGTGHFPGRTVFVDWCALNVKSSESWNEMPRRVMGCSLIMIVEWGLTNEPGPQLLKLNEFGGLIRCGFHRFFPFWLDDTIIWWLLVWDPTAFFGVLWPLVARYPSPSSASINCPMIFFLRIHHDTLDFPRVSW